jgi:ornithine cyclodeaminase/alanine dehydrogenase-like protein (mu-crystallin family)
MKFVPGDEVHRLCDWQRLVAALAEGHRGTRPLTGRAGLELEMRGHRQSYLNLPAWLPGIAMGSKLVTVVPDNPERLPGVPAIQAAYVLFDGNDGTPLAHIDGTALTYRKTAADSALGAQLLADDAPGVLALVGAGGLAPYLARAHRAVHPSLARVVVWNRTPQRADAVAAGLRAEGVDAEATGDIEAAVRAADIVSCCTASSEPVVRGDWLKAGAHLDLVGAFTPDMRECDDAAVRRARLFVDSREFAVDKPGDLASPLARGIIAHSDIEADLFDLCRPGYKLVRRRDDVTLFKNGGGGHLDLMTALYIWQASGSTPT